MPSNSTSIRIYTYINATMKNGKLQYTNQSALARVTASNNSYTLSITYDSNGYQSQYAQLTLTGSTSREIHNTSSSSNVIPANLTNAKITVGGDGLDSSTNATTMNVTSFTVTKT